MKARTVVVTLACLILQPATASATPAGLALSLTPTTPATDEEVTVNVTFADTLQFFAFGTTFSPLFSVHGFDVELRIYIVPPPPLDPVECTAPSASAFDQSFAIGTLPAGNYTLDVSVVASETIGSGTTSFSVIPEPSTGLLLALGFAGLRACRPTRRCS